MNGETPAVTAVLGPTNTGKTHLAIERMLGHATGVIGFPLRLLARENYDRICRLRGSAAEVALITGEEKIIPRRPRWYVCTVEAMPVDLRLDFLAIDEIQLCADRERGHIFTDRLMRARGLKETMFLGAETMRPMIRRLAPDARFETRERLSTLSYAGSKKISRLPPRSAVVAFAIDDVYAIAELIRRQRGGAAIVMGALSPRTRNAQVAMFQEGEVDYLVATDAIGMGLNMAIDHVAFASTRKFDGRRRRQDRRRVNTRRVHRQVYRCRKTYSTASAGLFVLVTVGYLYWVKRRGWSVTSKVDKAHKVDKATNITSSGN